MSAAAMSAPQLARERRSCPHTPPCPDRGRDAQPVDRHPEHGWSLLCNGGVLFDDGTFLPPRPAGEMRPLRVVLHVWGLTQADAATTAAEAHGSERARLWEIVDMVVSTGEPCPIRPGDLRAVGYHAVYGRAWAAYPAGRAV